MRYTTIIDITEFPVLYRNLNARLLYLHLALKSGYHDEDRDLIRTSIRRLSTDTGLTVSAVRHGLRRLETIGMIARAGDDGWKVTKWTIQTPPTPRTQKTAKQSSSAGNLGERYQNEIEAYRQRVYAAVRASTKDELQQWLAELQEGRRLNHHGASIAPNQDNIRWLKSVIEKL